MNEKVKAFVTKYRMPIILVGVTVVAYFGYRWYQNRQGGNTSSGGATTGTGSNLNSLAPALVAGSSGPASGLNYYAGSTTVDLQQAASNPTQPNQVPTQDGEDQDQMTDQDLNPGGPEQPPPGTWNPQGPHGPSVPTSGGYRQSAPATNVQEARTMPRQLNTAPHSTSMKVSRTVHPAQKRKPKRQAKKPTIGAVPKGT